MKIADSRRRVFPDNNDAKWIGHHLLRSPPTLTMLVVRKASKSVSIPLKNATTLISPYPPLPIDSVTTRAAHPGGGIAGRPLAAVNTWTGDPFRTI